MSNVKTTDAAVGEKAVEDVVAGSIPRVANVAGNTMRIQTDKLTEDETLQIKAGLTEAYGVTDNEVTSTFIGPTWGADVTKQALLGLGDLRRTRRRADGAVLPDLEDVALGDRRHAGDHVHHRRRLRPERF